MEINHRLYPYPVLSRFSDDYKDDKFETTVSGRSEGFHIVFDMAAVLTNDGLKHLIREGNATYTYHLECAQTGFRKVHLTDKETTTISIPREFISGKLEICSFVVATQDIIGYTNESFNDDYHGVAFDIEAGCVIAVGTQFSLHISKEREDLAYTPSVFSIIRNLDDKEKQMIVVIDNQKIIVKLPIDDYYTYKKLNQSPMTHNLLNALTVIPALIYALDELKLRSIEERLELSEYAWYRAVRKSLLKNFNCDVESDDFNNQNTVVLAQRLINDPITKAFELLRGGTVAGEEEDV
jgi:hypothetical protein